MRATATCNPCRCMYCVRGQGIRRKQGRCRYVAACRKISGSERWPTSSLAALFNPSQGKWAGWWVGINCHSGRIASKPCNKGSRDYECVAASLSRIVLRRYFGDNASGSQVAQNSSNLHLRGMYDEYCTQQMGEDCCICDGHLRVFRVRMMKEINIIRPEINIPDSIVLMWVTPSGIFPTKYVATRPDPPKSSRSKDNPK